MRIAIFLERDPGREPAGHELGAHDEDVMRDARIVVTKGVKFE